MEAIPSGEELVEHYLKPLSSLPEIEPFIRLNTNVLSVGRKNTDKIKNANQENISFVAHSEQNGAKFS